jgi:hypothetical protein
LYIHVPIYDCNKDIIRKMNFENPTIKTLDEIWMAIESFGIKREIFERSNPTYEELKDLYLLINRKKN